MSWVGLGRGWQGLDRFGWRGLGVVGGGVGSGWVGQALGQSSKLNRKWAVPTLLWVWVGFGRAGLGLIGLRWVWLDGAWFA